MPYSIGLAGKGGTGKTTVAGLLVKYLVGRGKVPVLAVDADANSNLNEVLGLDVEETLGKAREEMKKGVAAGMTKDVFMQMKIQEAVVEAKGFDLIVMGRPEGTGCYCAANHMLRQSIDRLAKNYDYVVIDCEAGMEHISRQTTQDIDYLLAVTDPTMRGLNTAKRLQELISEMRTSVKAGVFLVLNRLKNGIPPAIEDEIKKSGLILVATIPEDFEVTDLDIKGDPLTKLPIDSRFRRSVQEMLFRLKIR